MSVEIDLEDQNAEDVKAKLSRCLDSPPRAWTALRQFGEFQTAALHLRRRATTSEDLGDITNYQLGLALQTLADVFHRPVERLELPVKLQRPPCRERYHCFVNLAMKIDKIGRSACGTSSRSFYPNAA